MFDQQLSRRTEQAIATNPIWRFLDKAIADWQAAIEMLVATFGVIVSSTYESGRDRSIHPLLVDALEPLSVSWSAYTDPRLSPTFFEAICAHMKNTRRRMKRHNWCSVVTAAGSKISSDEARIQVDESARPSTEIFRLPNGDLADLDAISPRQALDGRQTGSSVPALRTDGHASSSQRRASSRTLAIMSPIARFDTVAIDCSDPRALAAFYGAIIGTAIDEGRTDSDWVELHSPGGAKIAFQQVENHTPPVWPGHEHPQRLHLDFNVDDLDTGEARVLALGARKAEFQPGVTFRVFLDPAGHPFCLVWDRALRPPGADSAE